MKRFFIHYIGIIAVAYGIFGLLPQNAFAANTPVSGWAWSFMPNGSNQVITPGNNSGGQGLGWISLDTSNGGNVQFDPTTGQFSGHGWTPYGGWLDFNPTGPYPAGPNHGAQVDIGCLRDISRVNCMVTGWARFLAGTGNNPSAGGWDGWVSMSGTGYGVQIKKHPNAANPTNLVVEGNAWGDDVVGWVGFGANITLPESVVGCMTSGDANFNPLATVHDPNMCAKSGDTCVDNKGVTRTYQGQKPYECEKAVCYFGNIRNPSSLDYYLANYPVGVLPKECQDDLCKLNPNHASCAKTCSGVGTYAGNTYTVADANNLPCQCTTGVCTGSGTTGPLNPGYKEN